MIKKISALLLIIFVIASALAVNVLADGEIPTEFVTEPATESGTFTGYVSTFNNTMRYEMIFLLVLVALCYFETVLTNKENKNLGFILPALTFIAMTVMTVIYSVKAEAFSIVGFIITFIFMNIPTLILYLIYHFGRKKYEKEAKK